MLTCRDVATSATEYMEGGLSMRTRLEFRVHLLLCRVCRLYVGQLAVTRLALRWLRRPLPSDQDLDVLLQMFRSDRNAPTRDHGRPR